MKKRYFLIIGILILLLIGGCFGVQKSSSKGDGNVNLSKYNQTKKERYADTKDSLLQDYVDAPHKPHPDSIQKWNAELMAEKEKYKVKPDAQTKTFTINPETGEVSGSPLISFKGVLDEDYWQFEKNKRDALRRKFTEIEPKLREDIMKGKTGELWYGDPKNVEIEGTPEAAHSGRGPIGFLYTDTGANLIVLVGYPHGGMMDEIFFFNSNGSFIKRHELDRPLNMPSVEFNAEQTFVIVSDGVNGDFYFFTIKGELERKGNFNTLTGDKGTSYGKPIISENGMYWVLNNNLRWFYNQAGNNIAKSNLFVAEIDEKLKIALCYEYINLMSKEGRIYVKNIEDNKIIYRSNIIQFKNFTYEIKK